MKKKILFITILSLFLIGCDLKKPVDEHEHNFVKIEEELSTCTKQGFIKYECDSCSKTKEETLSLLEHDYVYVSNNDATCVKDETETGTCSVCGDVTTRTINDSKTDHHYVYVSNNDATCVKDETENGTCSVCGDVTTRTVNNSKTDHHYVYVSNNDATCIKDGTETGTCSVCGDISTRTINDFKVNHKYVYVSNNDATCIKDGTETGTCSVCADITTRTVNNSKVDHNMVEYLTPAGCYENEKVGTICKECGLIEAKEVANTYLGHSFDDQLECSRCKAKYSDHLEFVNNYVTGLGICKDNIIVFPTNINGRIIDGISNNDEFKDVEAVLIPSAYNNVGNIFSKKLNHLYIDISMDEWFTYWTRYNDILENEVHVYSYENGLYQEVLKIDCKPGGYLFRELNNFKYVKEITLYPHAYGVSTCALAGCANLETINIYLGNNSNNVRISEWFGSTYIENSDIVTRGPYLYFSPKSLKTINIKSGSVFSNTFEGMSSIETISLSNTIKKIEIRAFNDCKKLKNIYYEGTVDEYINNIITEYSFVDKNNPLINGVKFHFIENGNVVEQIENLDLRNISTIEDGKLVPIKVKNLYLSDKITNIDITSLNYLNIENLYFDGDLSKLIDVLNVDDKKASNNCYNLYHKVGNDYELVNKLEIDNVNTLYENALCGIDGITELILGANIKKYEVGCLHGLSNIKELKLNVIETNSNQECYSVARMFGPNEYNDTFEVSFNTLLVSHTDYVPKSLSTVTILNDIINPYFLNNMTNVTRINFPENATLNNSCFRNTGIKTIELYSENIPNDCFYGCEKLEKVVLNGVKSIGSRAFSECKKLKEVIFDDELYSISDEAFASCEALRSIRLGKNVQIVGESAFKSCVRLTDVINLSEKDFSKAFPNAIRVDNNDESYIKTLDNGIIVFDNKESRYVIGYSGESTDVSLGDLFNGESYKIARFAFYESNIEKIYFSEYVNAIYEYIFYNDFDLREINVSEKNEYFKSVDGVLYTKDGSIIINYPINKASEEYIVPDGVKEITSFIFDSNKHIKTIVLPESLERIGTAAFNFCSVENIVLPNKVIELDNNCFQNAENLKSINLPEGMTTISQGLFMYCLSLENITLPGTITTIGKFAFQNCESLKEIVIPEGVTEIPQACFYACLSLKNVTLSESVTSLGIGAFMGCDFEYIDLKNVETISSSCFQQCYSLKEIIFTEKFKDFKGSEQFLYCLSLERVEFNNSQIDYLPYHIFAATGLKEFTVPESVEKIDDGCFLQSKLEKLYFGKNVTSFNGDICTGFDIYYSGSIEDWININRPKNYLAGFKPYNFYILDGDKYIPLENLIIPDTVTELQISTFSNIQNLKKVEISSSVKNIGTRCFEDCVNLEEVTFNDGLENIGKYAFINCGIKNVILPSSLKTVEKGAFYKCNIMNLELNEGLESVDETAFYGLSIYKITLPSTLNSISSSGFGYNKYLVQVTNHSNLKLTIGATTNGRVCEYAKVIITDDSDYVSIEGDYVIYDDGVNKPEIIRYIGENKIYIKAPINIHGKEYNINKNAFDGYYVIQLEVPFSFNYNIYNVKEVFVSNSDRDSNIDIVDGFYFYNNAFPENIYVANPKETLVFPENYNYKYSQANYYNINIHSFISNDVETIIFSKFNYHIYMSLSIAFPNVKNVIIPKGVYGFDLGEIKEDVNIFFEGSYDEFCEMDILNDGLDINKKKYFNQLYLFSENQPTDTEHNYYHYDENGAIVKWEK